MAANRSGRPSTEIHLPVATASIASPPFETGESNGAMSGASNGAGDDKLLLVGDIARASGKTVRAIHHYEDVGLLRPHARSKGRYRLYDQAAVARVRWIGKMHDLGLSLSEIQNIVQAWERASSAPGAMAQIRGVYRQKLDDTRLQIAHLIALERELSSSLEYLDTCVACDPGEIVAACCQCNYHDPAQLEPELVAGIHGGGRSRHPSDGDDVGDARSAEEP